MARRFRSRFYRAVGFEALESKALMAADTATDTTETTTAFEGPRRGGRNAVDPFDVNRDNQITNLDVFTLISKMRASGSAVTLEDEPLEEGDETPCYDVTDDGVITNLDVFQVIGGLRSETKLNAGALVYLEAELTGADGLTASVEYSVARRHGLVERHFEASVTGATPGAELAVTVAGVEVGKIVVGEDGAGTLKFSNRPKEGEDAVAFPETFPDVVAGDAVDIGGSASGTLDVADTSEDPSEPPPAPEHPHGGGASIHTILRGDSLAYAQVKLSVHSTEEGVEVQLAVRLQRAEAGTYDVKINDTVVGTITVGDNGRGQIVFSTNPEGDEVAFPADLALEGTLSIAVGDDLAGEITFPLPPGSRDGVLLSAELSGVSGATGTATLSVSPDDEHLLPNLEVKVVVDGGTADSILPILIGTTEVGTITLDAAGHGEAVFSTHPGEGELLLDLDFPLIKPGSTIAVGDLVTGVFSIPAGSEHPHPLPLPPPPHGPHDGPPGEEEETSETTGETSETEHELPPPPRPHGPPTGGSTGETGSSDESSETEHPLPPPHPPGPPRR